MHATDTARKPAAAVCFEAAYLAAAEVEAAWPALAPDERDQLAEMLRPLFAGAPAPKRKAPARKPARAKKADPLLDTRITAELWIAGEDPGPRDRAERRAIKKGRAYRPILVRFADGYEVRAGSYIADDEHAKAAAVRYARSLAMERRFALEPWAGGGWQWITIQHGPHKGAAVKTRACEVPEVVAVEFLAAPAPERAPEPARVVMFPGLAARLARTVAPGAVFALHSFGLAA